MTTFTDRERAYQFLFALLVIVSLAVIICTNNSQDAAIAELQAAADTGTSRDASSRDIQVILWGEFLHRHQLGLVADSANMATIDSLVIAWDSAREGRAYKGAL